MSVYRSGPCAYCGPSSSSSGHRAIEHSNWLRAILPSSVFCEHAGYMHLRLRAETTGAGAQLAHVANLP
jgi:hypothetical protein